MDGEDDGDVLLGWLLQAGNVGPLPLDTKPQNIKSVISQLIGSMDHSQKCVCVPKTRAHI
jgi:hypothetical protein